VALGQEVEYLDNKGLDAKHYKALVLDLLALGPQRRAKINAMLLSKLPASIASDRSRKVYIKTFYRTWCARARSKTRGATNAALWRLRQKN
jgi:ATP-dependent DNA helicase RecG